jgi:hypothetical protein
MEHFWDQLCCFGDLADLRLIQRKRTSIPLR